MAHQWEYADAATQQVGTMICTACRRRITEGQYRFRETDDAYLPQHRKCSSTDPQWALLDRKDEAQRNYERRRTEAYAAFVREFGVPDDLVRERAHEQSEKGEN